MRKRFEQQTELGLLLIEDTPVLKKSRDDIPELLTSLLAIYQNPNYNTELFNILENKINKGKKKTGRRGLNLWQIFVLAQFRLALNLDYDRLHYMANTDSALRQLLGIETQSGFKRIGIGYQRILDNLHLLDNKTLMEINDVIVTFGHAQVFKKKEAEALSVKTDSFVVESNVHFPTDYNLLWDCARKALDMIKWFKKEQPSIQGWRKSRNWFKSLKNLSRAVGQASSSGGANKEIRVKVATKKYLTKAMAFSNKLETSKASLPIEKTTDVLKLIELEGFIFLLKKHINLLERRVLKGEKIPHQEKLFSIFEHYTEWVSKGKRRPNVELGKKLSITTDQYGLIIDGYIMNAESDSQIVLSTAERILLKYNIRSWSFDKGYWHKDNKAFLQTKVEHVIMPKKGKTNKAESQEEQAPLFKKMRNKHSAVESNINELEHNGLDRCPDKGFHGFQRYTGMAITAYNLKKIGREILKTERELNKKKKQKIKAAA